MRREDLYFALFEQQKDFEEEVPFIKRELTKQVLKFLQLKLPIVITGVRRCGKSVLLKLIKNELKLKRNEYLYVNFNDDRLVDFSVEDFQKIIDFANENKYSEDCTLFIDEIQETNRWEKWIDRVRNKHRIILTGSNSKLLSREISTILTGRSISCWLSPFNFKEFLDTKNISLENWKLDLKLQATLRAEFKEYMESGGVPQRIISGQRVIISELYENILYRDIIKRFNKNLTKPIRELSVYLLSNPSSPISLRSVSQVTGIKNFSTIKSVLDSFESAFVFFFINKFDFSAKKQMQNPRKVYCIDNGFLSELGFRMSEDKGKLLENLVAIELKRRGKEIFYHLDKNECDFVVRNNKKITEAIQVCYNLNEKDREREIAGLIEAMNKFDVKEGIILTNDQYEEIKDLRIKVIPVWKWLIS